MAFEWSDNRYIGFDLETSGTEKEFALQPWRYAQGKAWITSLAVVQYDPGLIGYRVFGDLFPNRTQLIEFLETAIENKQTIVGWNTVFDISWLLAYGLEDWVFACKWLDGLLLWKHAAVEPEYDMDRAHKKSYGLKTCVEEFLPEWAGYEDAIDFHATDPESLAKLHTYNKRDTIFTLKLAKHWWYQLSEQQRQVAIIESQCLPYVAQANLNGFPVDTLVASELSAHLKREAERIQLFLAPVGMTREIIASPAKLASLMYDTWGLTPLKETKSGNRSTDKETLHELAISTGDPRIRELRKYREALNQRTKFAEAPLESARYCGDNRTHPSAFVFSTYTGRLTYASKQGKNKDERPIGFAIHQEKREGEFRDVLVPPPGHTLVEFDAAGQEFKWMAVASRDQVMLSLCLPGQDPHTYMGAQIGVCDYRQLMALVSAGDKPAKKLRQAGKPANFSLQYKTSAPRFCAIARVDYGLDLSMSEAERIWGIYRNTYTEVPVYWDKQKSKTKRLGYVETMAGRRVKVVGDWSKDGWRMAATGINFPVQGTGADQKYLAIAVLKTIAAKYAAKFALDMHDGLLWFVPKDNTKQFIVEGKHLLDNLPYKRAWGLDLPIQMSWDAKFGASWGGLKSWVP
jgi:DNA polymerase I-like protein with 3'-5' exonuclease and polymerase domains